MSFLRRIAVLMTVALTVAGSSACAGDLPFNRLVTAPTAGSLKARQYTVETHLFDGGGVVETVTFGLHDLINIGVSYGGADLVGSSSSVFQPHVAMQMRLRIIEETLTNPAVSIGFDSQGTGPYIKGDHGNRFQSKSRGAYVVVSRNYKLLGDFGIHGGANFSIEDGDGDKDPSFWAGLNKSIGPFVEVCGEYDFASNDNDQGDLTIDKGFLNAAVKWSLGGDFTIEFDLRNLLRNDVFSSGGGRLIDPQPAREIRLFYRNRL